MVEVGLLHCSWYEIYSRSGTPECGTRSVEHGAGLQHMLHDSIAAAWIALS